MAIHKLVPYWISVREVEEPETTWDMTNIRASEPNFPENNLADYFMSFIKNYKEDVYVDQEEQETFTVAKPVSRKGNTIEGRFKSGEWGRNADFWDIDEHERIEDAREENHAEEIPYYFLFHIPDADPHRALLILSKYKRKGIKTTFSNLFSTNRSDQDVGDAYMEIDPHYSSDVEDKLDEVDQVASVRFRGTETVPAREKYADRSNIERAEKELSGQLNLGTEVKYTPKDNEEGFKQYVKGLIPGNGFKSKDSEKIKEKEESVDFSYGHIREQNYSNASVTVVEGESQLTFSLWQKRIQMRMDVDPDEHGLDVYGGHPTPHTIGSVARQLTNDLMEDENTEIQSNSLIPKGIGVPEETETT
jgi:hypothetical protein